MDFAQFVRFALVGCTGILIDFSITWICREMLHWNKYVSSSTGFCFAVLNNYLLNKFFTFQYTDAVLLTQFSKYFLISVIGLALSNSFLFLFQKHTRLNFWLSKAFIIGLIFFWNYSANSLYTFKH